MKLHLPAILFAVYIGVHISSAYFSEVTQHASSIKNKYSLVISTYFHII